MWNQLSAKQRCRIVASVAGRISDRSQDLIDACASDQRTDSVETITGELLPLCAALKYLGKYGAKILAPRKVGVSGRPVWMLGVRSVVQRVPLGDVLVLGTWNYPLLLPGVQIAQGLVAGNRIQLKPAIGTDQVSEILCDCFYQSGVPSDQLELLDSSTAAATGAIERGVDLIVLTGAAETGRRVLSSAAPHLSASIMELSGCDAVIVLPDADLRRLALSVEFGLKFNASATCIGPRRLMVSESQRDQVLTALTNHLDEQAASIVHPAARQSVADLIAAALDGGAIDVFGKYSEDRLREEGELFPLLLDGVTSDLEIASADVFAPVLSIVTVTDVDHAVRLVNECRYRLAASVFGPTNVAKRVAERLEVGTVTINDLIAPTADPRLPFGGRGHSGFGVTRGPEGLLSMTAVKVVSTRRGLFLPHLRPRTDSDRVMLHSLLKILHGGSFSKKIAGLRGMVGGVKKEQPGADKASNSKS